MERFDDVTGIVVSGTILRGVPAPTSDLDIYVIRQKLQRQRLQRFFNGVPAEIFVNPAAQVLTYFVEERRAGRPITAHMLGTGFVILERSPEVAELRLKAREVLSLSPDLDAERLTTLRYMAALRYEDATDVSASQPETATMILGLAVYAMLHYAFLKANRYIPRDKDLLERLTSLSTDLASLARAFYGTASLEERLSLAAQIAERTIETQGFFEWESGPEELGP
jgi:predicted nucleotidyltransferase